MSDYPWQPLKISWKRPPIDHDILKQCTQKSDMLGLLHCLGTLAILTASGTFAYLMFAEQHWFLLALSLYLHGGLFAFQPQTHEFSHSTVFTSRWLNRLFKRIFGIIYWPGNSVLYKMSHDYHHRYTLHRQGEGEVVQPTPETTERILQEAVKVIDLTGFLMTVYDKIYFIFKPYLRNSRRSAWQRYVYEQSSRQEQRDAYRTQVYQFLLHVLFAVFAISIGMWFLIVVVSLPSFYGGKWYALWVHDTMHVGRQPETDDFRLCCRSVRVDPITSFLYWHMEYHTEHHSFAAIPCYRLKKFHRLTREHWEAPQSLFQAWREMNRKSEEMLAMAPSSDE